MSLTRSVNRSAAVAISATMAALSLGCALAVQVVQGFTNPTVFIQDSALVEVSFLPQASAMRTARPEPLQIVGGPYSFFLMLTPSVAVDSMRVERAEARYMDGSVVTLMMDRAGARSADNPGAFTVHESPNALPWRRFDLRVTVVLSTQRGPRRIEFEVPIETQFTSERYNRFWAVLSGG